MFGILYALGLGVGAIVSGTKNLISESQSYENGRQRFQSGLDLSGTYIDRKGVWRDLNTKEYVEVRRSFYDSDDDDLYVWKNGIKIRNVSEAERQRNFRLGKNGDWHNRTADLYNKRYWSFKKGINVKIKGCYYKDLITDQLYVCRRFKIDNRAVLFYMDITNGLLVRKSDAQYESEMKYPNYKVDDIKVYNFIVDFNQKQKDGGWYRDTDYRGKLVTDFYCNKFEMLDHTESLYELKYGGKS